MLFKTILGVSRVSKSHIETTTLMGCLLERDMMMKTLKEVIEFKTIRDDIEFAYAAADARKFAKQEVGRQPRRDR
jgi:hypothetical protein